jgi:hypothetical protein
MRIGCWNVCMFVALEQIKKQFAWSSCVTTNIYLNTKYFNI